MRRFYEPTLWILQKFLPTNPDLHHGLLDVEKLLAGVKSSREMKVKADFYGYGESVMEFQTAGLKWDK